METNIKTLKELLHLTYNEDGKYIVSWRRPDFQVESENESAEISKEDFEKIQLLVGRKGFFASMNGNINDNKNE